LVSVSIYCEGVAEAIVGMARRYIGSYEYGAGRYKKGFTVKEARYRIIVAKGVVNEVKIG